jgi:hypothetical protein
MTLPAVFSCMPKRVSKSSSVCQMQTSSNEACYTVRHNFFRDANFERLVWDRIAICYSELQGSMRKALLLSKWKH